VPVVGAIGGASLNLIFVEHFQEMAEAHFDVRRLERRSGEQAIEQAYARIVADVGASALPRKA
jgi:hypothetical protein